MADSDRKFMLFWDIRTGEARYRWRLRESSSQTVEWSTNSYTDKSECTAAIELVKKRYPEVPVVDLTIARS